MKDKVNVVGWISWLWSLWPWGWVVLIATILDVIISLSVGSFCGCGNAVVSFILAFLMVGLGETMVIMFGYLGGIAFLEAWPGIKRRCREWWDDRPQ